MIFTTMLKWWLTFCSSILGLAILGYFDFFDLLYTQDLTRISFVILSIFGIASISLGFKTYNLTRNGGVYSLKIYWYIVDSLTVLGLTGTLIGMLVMLRGAFEGLNVEDTASFTATLTTMAVGLGTTLLTTLCGIVTAQILKYQLVNFEAHDTEMGWSKGTELV